MSIETKVGVKLFTHLNFKSDGSFPFNICCDLAAKTGAEFWDAAEFGVAAAVEINCWRNAVTCAGVVVSGVELVGVLDPGVNARSIRLRACGGERERSLLLLLERE